MIFENFIYFRFLLYLFITLNCFLYYGSHFDTSAHSNKNRENNIVKLHKNLELHNLS